MAENCRFILNNYDSAEPFSSFLPGIAGKKGIPLWCFYTNRGQGISCFGRGGKDSPILEFLPADRAYRETERLGFRTFYRLRDRSWREAFASAGSVEGIQRQMSIGKTDLRLLERCKWLESIVDYTILPEESFPALLRMLTVTNKENERLRMEIADGLPRIVPNGITDQHLKMMSTTASAWIKTDISSPPMPLYRIRHSIEDSLAVSSVAGANFYVSSLAYRNKQHLLTPVVDSSVLFGSDTSFSRPAVFIEGGLPAIKQRKSVLHGKYPAGFSVFEISLEPGESCSLQTMVGFSKDQAEIQGRVFELMQSKTFLDKFERSAEIVADLLKPLSMDSADPRLNAYTAVSGLDNLLRGGSPLVWNGNSREKRVYHVYSRKHGDMERDYNDFFLPENFYSAGFGNYRDMNQNRRSDVFLHPETEDAAITLFMSLIQPDGYNPLIIQPGKFFLLDNTLFSKYPFLRKLSANGFTPDSLLLEAEGGLGDPDIAEILEKSVYRPEAFFGEGYWADHWVYNLDLIEQFLRIYPDREEELFFRDRKYLWFTSRVTIRPIDQRFKKWGETIQQEEHLAVIDATNGDYLEHKSTLFEKLLTLALIKGATLGIDETGIEMEAGRPGWNDSLNGLPALFGSSLTDAVELIRLIEMLLAVYGRYGDKEIKVFAALSTLAARLKTSFSEPNNVKRWKLRWEMRTEYRKSIAGGAPPMEDLNLADLVPVLNRLQKSLSQNIKKAESGGLMPCFFMFSPKDWVESGTPGYLMPTDFNKKNLPLFLEGIVKQLKRVKDKDEAAEILRKVKQSPLFDAKLKMYKLNETLDGVPSEVGRAKAFPHGWLENGSIWLHMEYKFLLELLKAGIIEEFWEEAQNCLIPFMDSAVYGRSIYENSSFIASCSYPEESVHGKGFVARLSGATAEYLTIWSYFLLGPAPFLMERDGLVFCPTPALPGKLFHKDGTLQWKLFGKTDIIYRNPKGKDLFHIEGPIRLELTDHQGNKEEFHGKVSGGSAIKLREGHYKALIAEF